MNNNGFNEEWQQPLPFHNIVLPTFDTNIFPKWLREYVNSVAEETQTPRDAAGMTALTMLSTILGGSFEVRPNKTSWREVVSIFAVVALEPANRKSAVFSLLLKAIIDFEKQESTKVASNLAEKRAEQNAKIKRISELEKEYSKATEIEQQNLLLKEIKELEKSIDETLNPVNTSCRLYSSDVTPEKLAELLHAHNGRFAILSSEGAEFFDMASGKYSDKSNIDIYLKGYSGENVVIDRKGSPSILIEKTVLTIGVFVQPSVIKNTPQNFSERGLIQRFLYSLPQSTVGYRNITPQPIQTEIKLNFEKNINKLFTLMVNQEEKNKVSKELKFSSEATEYLRQVQEEIEIMLRNQDMNPIFKGWLGKLVGQIVRIAGLLHVAEYVESDSMPLVINVETLKKADQLRIYFIKHAEAAFGIIGDDTNGEDIIYVLNKINSPKFANNQCIANQELWQGMKHRFENVQKYNKIIDFLEEMDYIKIEIRGKKKFIHINPYLRNLAPNSPNC
ncbi:MAG: YfjI family protein [Solibacillus sp.]